MKRTTTTHRRHEIELALANANKLLVDLIQHDRTPEDTFQTRELINEMKDVRHKMLNDIHYNPSARVQAIEQRMMERKAFTSNPPQTPPEGLRTDQQPCR